MASGKRVKLTPGSLVFFELNHRRTLGRTLHRGDAGLGSGHRGVGLTGRDDLAVARLLAKAKLARRVFVHLEFASHQCLLAHGTVVVRQPS